jgi:hypothetical protein
MNKVMSDVLAVVITAFFILTLTIVKPLECFLEAMVDSRMYSFSYFMESFATAWGDERKPKFSDYKNFFENP